MTAKRHRDSFREQDVHQKSPQSSQINYIPFPLSVMPPPNTHCGDAAGSVAARGATESGTVNG